MPAGFRRGILDVPTLTPKVSMSKLTSALVTVAIGLLVALAVMAACVALSGPPHAAERESWQLEGEERP